MPFHIDKLSSFLVTFIAKETLRGKHFSFTKPHGKGGESRNKVTRQRSLRGRKIRFTDSQASTDHLIKQLT